MKFLIPIGMLLLSSFFTFNLIAQTCIIDYNIEISPPLSALPALGPGTEVEICVTVEEWASAGSNLFHGLSFDFGPQFKYSSLHPSYASPSCQGSSVDQWQWHNAIFRYTEDGESPGFVAGPGFFYDGSTGSPLGVPDGDPANNFGDNCTISTGDSVWMFCVKITYTGGADPGVLVRFHPDSQTGRWSNNACINEFVSMGKLCPRPFDLYGTVYTPDAAVVEWTGSTIAIVQQVAHRELGTVTPTFSYYPVGVDIAAIFWLTGDTEYEWSLKAKCGTSFFSRYTPASNFTTPPFPFGATFRELPQNEYVDLAVFPNPTTDLLEVRLVGSSAEDAIDLRVFDLTGKLLIEQKDQQIDVSNLAAGTYFVEALNQRQLFIKQ